MAAPVIVPLGRLLSTPGAIRACEAAGVEMATYFARHATGDWGDLGDDDKRANTESLRDGERLLSAYTLPDQTRIWIITEWDRSVTTVLLPAEY